MACGHGARAGTFVLSFDPLPATDTVTPAAPATPEHLTGSCMIHSGTGDVELLSVAGTTVGAGVFPFLGVGRWYTGTISFPAPLDR